MTTKPFSLFDEMTRITKAYCVVNGLPVPQEAKPVQYMDAPPKTAQDMGYTYEETHPRSEAEKERDYE